MFGRPPCQRILLLFVVAVLIGILIVAYFVVVNGSADELQHNLFHHVISRKIQIMGIKTWMGLFFPFRDLQKIWYLVAGPSYMAR